MGSLVRPCGGSCGGSWGDSAIPEPACYCTPRAKRLRVRGLFKRRICFAIIKGDKDPSPCSVGPNWLYCHQLLCNTLQPERRRPGTSHTMAWPLFSQPLLEWDTLPGKNNLRQTVLKPYSVESFCPGLRVCFVPCWLAGICLVLCLYHVLEKIGITYQTGPIFVRRACGGQKRGRDRWATVALEMEALLDFRWEIPRPYLWPLQLEETWHSSSLAWSFYSQGSRGIGYS